MYRILLVEDDLALAGAVRRYLESYAMRCSACRILWMWWGNLMPASPSWC